MSVIRQIFKGLVLDVRLERATLPTGMTLDLEMVRHPGAAAVVAVNEHSEVTLLHQYRHATGGFIWEIPAGKLDDNESPEHCAARELQEEAGLHAGELIRLGAIFTAPGFCDEKIHLLLARNLSPVAQQLEADEVLTIDHFSMQQALAMIRAGAIEDAKSIAGLHHAAAYLGIA
ncbi:MAG: NUDIX hydrolase [Deltaproteobacteria bacterium]|nr:NUDIX hydrolase [Deltaproteobacteria bacterium]MBI3388812.1 NUDIX hydrolase [Deltaproteobacteria bacterium]